MRFLKFFLAIIYGICLCSCEQGLKNSSTQIEESDKELEMKFVALHDSITGVTFRNDLREDNRINYFNFSVHVYGRGGLNWRYK